MIDGLFKFYSVVAKTNFFFHMNNMTSVLLEDDTPVWTPSTQKIFALKARGGSRHFGGASVTHPRHGDHSGQARRQEGRGL